MRYKKKNEKTVVKIEENTTQDWVVWSYGTMRIKENHVIKAEDFKRMFDEGKFLEKSYIGLLALAFEEKGMIFHKGEYHFSGCFVVAQLAPVQDAVTVVQDETLPKARDVLIDVTPTDSQDERKSSSVSYGLLESVESTSLQIPIIEQINYAKNQFDTDKIGFFTRVIEEEKNLSPVLKKRFTTIIEASKQQAQNSSELKRNE